MSLRLAHVLSPEAQFIPATPRRYYNASGEITDILTDFTHLIEPEDLWSQGMFESEYRPKQVPGGRRHRKTTNTPSKFEFAIGQTFKQYLPARYTLDLESLPPAEALALAQEIGRIVRHHSTLSPSIGLAENKFTAQIAASLTQPNHARPVLPGEEAQFLASRTIHYLPLDKESARRLSHLGIRTLGQLSALPMASLQEQFGLMSKLGRPLAQLYQLAQSQEISEGDYTSPMPPVRSLAGEKQEQLTFRFEGPVGNTLVLERALNRMATEVAGRLQNSGLEGRSVHLTWERDDRPGRYTSNHPDNEQTGVTLLRRHPTADPQKLTDSLHELLHQAFHRQAAFHRKAAFDGQGVLQGISTEQGQNDLQQGIIALSVIISDLVPVSVNQGLLFGPTNAAGRFQEILNNIIAKHGKTCFLRPVLTNNNHPLPERRFKMLTWGSE
jgi:nucleotidyltransferase/DNA polymerase involved in DNA repair